MGKGGLEAGGTHKKGDPLEGAWGFLGEAGDLQEGSGVPTSIMMRSHMRVSSRPWRDGAA